MKPEKGSFIKSIISIIFVLSLPIFLLGIQGIKQEGGSYAGVIQSMDKDLKYVVVGGTKFFISSDTKITDEKGSMLKASDLKLKTSVVIEGAPTQGGISAKKIVIQKGP